MNAGSSIIQASETRVTAVFCAGLKHGDSDGGKHQNPDLRLPERNDKTGVN